MDVIDAILHNDTETLLVYLILGGDPDFFEDAAELTLLHHAVASKSIAAISLLLIFGGNPFRPDHLLYQSAFELAIENDKLAAFIFMVIENLDLYNLPTDSVEKHV